MTDGKREIEELRSEMGKLDTQLLALLERRARAAKRVGELRAQTPQLSPGAFGPSGDRASLQALAGHPPGDLPPDAVRSIFREVFAACSALEMSARVAFPGPEGGPAHAVSRGRFGAGATFLAVDGTSAALDEVARHRADVAVIPLETRAEGPVQSTLLALTQHDLRIVAVVEDAWSLHLVNKTGNYADIEKVYATAADRAAASTFVQLLGPKVAVMDTRSPLVACQIALEDHGAGALASEAIGASAGLEVARRNVADPGDHRVRYAVVAARPTSRTGDDVTSFVFGLSDAKRTALLEVLQQFQARDLALLRLDSRPDTQPGDAEAAWNYLFFAEIKGHATDRLVASAFEEVKRLTRFFKVLGSYPAGG